MDYLNKGSITIFCDEKGYSGPNLFDDGQPDFLYSSVAINFDLAQEILNRARTDFKISDSEFKGSNLLNRRNGRQAIDYILEQVADKIYLVSMHKRYSLACKFFEYVFEPLIAKESSMFYELGFNRFVANVLFFESLCGGNKPITLLHNFQQFIREGRINNLEVLFVPPHPNEDLQQFIPQLQLFCNLHKDAIVNEFTSLGDVPLLLKWLLDLTETSLFRTLCYWGEKYDQLDVYCDSSKPLKENPDVFNVMINRKDRADISFMGRTIPMTFNLKEQIKVVDSRDYPGIQIADCVSAAAWYSVGKTDNEYSEKWQNYFTPPVLSDCCVFPEDKYLKLDNEDCFINTFIFNELIKRSQNGDSLLGNWMDIVIEAKGLFPFWLNRLTHGD